MTDPKQILQLTVAAGETLLQSGGEVFRVQQTMEIIARAYGAQDFHVYVLTNGIFASLTDGECPCTSEVRYVHGGTMHMGRIIAVNELSREIAAHRVPPQEALRRVRAIAQMPQAAPWLRVLSCAIGTACFAWLFGGSAQDALAAFFVGALLEPFRIRLERTAVNTFIFNLLCAVLVATASVCVLQLLERCGLVCSLDKVIIGGIIPLVPGIAITTAVRDVTGSDYLSGVIRGAEALLVAAAIAAGVGFVLALALPMLGVTL